MTQSILIVEDDLLIGLATKIKLESFGYNVYLKNSGEESVSYVESGIEVHLILMDIDLGKGIDGIEAARQILSKIHIPIIFFTSHTEPEFVKRVKEITRYGYLLKNSSDFVIQSSIEMAFELYNRFEEVRFNEQRFQKYFNNAPVAIVLSDLADGLIKEVNLKFLEITGYALSEVVGRTSVELGLSNSRKRDEVKELFSTNVLVKDVDFKLKRKNGELVDCLLSAELIEFKGLKMVLTTLVDISSRTEIIKKLDESEKKFLSLIQSLDDIVFTLDTNQKYTGFYGMRLQELGVLPEQYIGKKITEILKPDDALKYDTAQKQALLGNVVKYTVKGNQGDEERTFQTVLSPIWNNQDQIIGIVGVSRDITAQKLVKDLLNQEALWSEFILDAIIITDLSLKIKSWSKAAQTIYGWKTDEVIGKEIDELLQTSFVDVTREEAQAELAEKGVWRGLVTQRTKESKRVFIESAVTFLKDTDGNILGGIAVNRDVTVRLEQENLLKRKDNFLRVFAANFPGMLGFWDNELRCRFANSAYIQWFGRTEEEMIGLHIREVLGEVLFKKNEPYINEALKGNRQEFEREIPKPDGTVGYTMAQYIPLLEEQQVIGFFAVVTDITPIKKAENQLKLLLKEKDLILHEVHHRIKNNMNMMSSLLTLQAMGSDQPQVAEALKDASARINTMTSLYRKLYQSDLFTQVSVRVYITDLLRDMRALFSDYPIVIESDLMDFQLSHKIIPYVGIIVNELVTNGVKHAFKNRNGKINISIVQEDDHVLLMYADDGVGIEVKPNESSFGLRLIELLTEQLHGNLKIERGEQGGTQVKITFLAE